MFSTLHIAEKTTGSRGSLALLRWALVVIFLWFGCDERVPLEIDRLAVIGR